MPDAESCAKEAKKKGRTLSKKQPASSSELIDDRKEFEIFISRKNKEWINKGVFLELVIWEDFLDALSQIRLQNEYNKAIRQSDIFVMLFFTKVGKYPEEEFGTAFGQFKDTNKPCIFTCRKNCWKRALSFYREYPYDPKGGRENLEASKDDARVVRVGSFRNNLLFVRYSFRYRLVPDYWNLNLCFRVMLSPFISGLCSSEGCLMPKHELPCRYHDSIGIIRLIMRFVGHES